MEMKDIIPSNNGGNNLPVDSEKIWELAKQASKEAFEVGQKLGDKISDFIDYIFD